MEGEGTRDVGAMKVHVYELKAGIHENVHIHDMKASRHEMNARYTT